MAVAAMAARVLDETGRLTIDQVDTIRKTLLSIERELGSMTIVWLPAAIDGDLEELAHATFRESFPPQLDANVLVIVSPDDRADVTVGPRWIERIGSRDVERVARTLEEQCRHGRYFEGIEEALDAIFGDLRPHVAPARSPEEADAPASDPMAATGYRDAPSRFRFASSDALERLERERVGFVREIVLSRVRITSDASAAMRCGNLGHELAAEGFRYGGAIREHGSWKTLAADYFVSPSGTESVLARDVVRLRRSGLSRYQIQTTFDDGTWMFTRAKNRAPRRAEGRIIHLRACGELPLDLESHRAAIASHLRANPERSVIAVHDFDTVVRLVRAYYRCVPSLGTMARFTLWG